MNKGEKMDKNDVALEDLERMAAAMAQKIPELECPECCDCGWLYQYVEKSAKIYTEEWEWACFSNTIIRHHLLTKAKRAGLA